MSFSVVGIYSTELFPTTVRASTSAIAIMAGKLANIIAPQVILLVRYIGS